MTFGYRVSLYCGIGLLVLMVLLVCFNTSTTQYAIPTTGGAVVQPVVVQNHDPMTSWLMWHAIFNSSPTVVNHHYDNSIPRTYANDAPTYDRTSVRGTQPPASAASRVTFDSKPTGTAASRVKFDQPASSIPRTYAPSAPSSSSRVNFNSPSSYSRPSSSSSSSYSRPSSSSSSSSSRVSFGGGSRR